MPYLLSCDIHTHTMFSAHAYSTIEENVYWAAERGLQVLGSADHLSSMVTACPNDLRSYQFFINQDIWPRIWSGVLVLRGAEADIVSLDGSLFGEDTPVTLDIAGDSYSHQHSLFDLVTRNLDYLVASVHNPQIAEGATMAQTTEMYINALEHPKVFMLGHTGRSGVPFDIDEVLLAAKAKHKIIEINNHSLEHGTDAEHWNVCRKIAERCAELGVGIGVSTDAHIGMAIGKLDQARKMLDEAGWQTCQISCSNSLDEYIIEDILNQGAQIDMFGVGERLITARSEPVFGCVYKLVAVEDKDGNVVPKIKISENVGKITNPHFKKVYRLFGNDTGKAIADYLCVHDETVDDSRDLEIFDPQATWKRKKVYNFTAKELLVPIFQGGELVYKLPALSEIQAYCAQQVDTLWDEVKRFDNPHTYYVDLSQKLWDIKDRLLHEGGKIS